MPSGVSASVVESFSTAKSHCTTYVRKGREREEGKGKRERKRERVIETCCKTQACWPGHLLQLKRTPLSHLDATPLMLWLLHGAWTWQLPHPWRERGRERERERVNEQAIITKFVKIAFLWKLNSCRNFLLYSTAISLITLQYKFIQYSPYYYTKLIFQLLKMCLLFELSQIPYLNHAIVSAWCNEWVFFIPWYDIDVAVVSLGGDHTGFVRGSPAVPYANGLIHRTRGKNLIGENKKVNDSCRTLIRVHEKHSCNCSVGPWPPSIISLPYDHPHPSGSRQLAYARQWPTTTCTNQGFIWWKIFEGETWRSCWTLMGRLGSPRGWVWKGDVSPPAQSAES